jgi:hypothetical protein
MIIVLVYVIFSAYLFVWVLKGARFRRLPTKLVNRHPEMEDVRSGDPLLVVRFDVDNPPDPEEK